MTQNWQTAAATATRASSHAPNRARARPPRLPPHLALFMEGGGGGGGGSAAFKLGFPKRKALKAEKAAISAEQREEITEAFALFDVDKVGSIDYHELKVAMRALGCDVRKAEVKALVADYSKDGSERVDFEAFLAISAFDSAGAPFFARLRARPHAFALHPTPLFFCPSVGKVPRARPRGRVPQGLCAL